MSGLNYMDVIRHPLLTEKATDLKERHNQVAFKVHERANKKQIKEAIEKIFNVTVTGVRVANTPRKPKKLGQHSGSKPGFKKAIISMKEGDVIEIFERVD